MWIALRLFILDQQSTFLNDSSYRGFNYPTTTQRMRATDTQNGTSQKREADFCPDISDDVRVGTSFLSLSFPAIRLITFDADGPAPPVQEKTSGLKVACSTSRIRCSYFSFFICSCILYAPPMSFGHVLAWGLKIFTSKEVFENLFSHRPFARMSRRASSCCGSSICEGFASQSLKTRLDFDIVAYFVQEIGEGITDVIVSDVGVTTFWAVQCVGYCEWFVASTVTRKFNWFPSVSQLHFLLSRSDIS